MKTEAEKATLMKELDILNVEVTSVLAKRKAWMDKHMPDFARVQIGQEIFNLMTGERLGVVSKLYRYWDEQRNPLYDTTMDVCYEFETQPHIFDNTSRQRILVGLSSEVFTKPNIVKNWDEVFR